MAMYNLLLYQRHRLALYLDFNTHTVRVLLNTDPSHCEPKSAALRTVTVGDDLVSNPFRKPSLGGFAEVDRGQLPFGRGFFIGLRLISSGGREFLVLISWKLTNWSEWRSDQGAASHLFRKVDTKVWDYFIRSEEPTLRRISEDVNLGLLTKPASTYAEGFPIHWKTSEDIPRNIVNSFRQYARFWYQIIYKSTSGPRLGAHDIDLPADHPESETAAYQQVGDRLLSIVSAIPSTPRSESRQGEQEQAEVSIPITERERASLTKPGSGRTRRTASLEIPIGQSPFNSPLPRPSVSSRRAAMTTTFAHKVVSACVDEFDGKPQNLPLLDRSVENLCVEQAYPAYYGGTVRGAIDSGYEYVPAGTPGSSPNYYLGSRVCAAVCGKFTGDAKLWWAGYRKNDNPRPNCWKKASDNPEGEDSKPASVTEVSLYDLIDKAFPSNDAAQARSELRRLKWDPSLKDALSVSAFKYQVMELLERAGFNNWVLQCEEIRDCLEPLQFRDKIKSWDDPDDFWKEVKAASASWRHDHPPSARKCLHCNGPHDTKSCRKSSRVTRSDDSRSNNTCDFCGIAGHYKKNCFKYKASIRNDQQTVRQDDSMAPQMPPVQRKYESRIPSRNVRQPYPTGGRSMGRTDNDTLKNVICRTCQGVGHMQHVCPSRKTAMAAANVSTKDQDKSTTKDVPSYLMDTWFQYKSEAGVRHTNKLDAVVADEGVDEFFSLLFAEKAVDFPLFNNLTKSMDKDDVLSLSGNSAGNVTVKVSDALDMSQLGPPAENPPSGPLWSVCTTMRNQDLLTIFDTGAVKAAIPRSTVTGTSTPWSTETPHPISFVKSDGSRYKPAGFCPSFKFRFGTSTYDIEAYVVDNAPFQLLLGTEFLWATGAGLFPRWNRVILTAPHRVASRKGHFVLKLLKLLR
ncbi:hypothetical protein EDC01DRAFT_631103 [Geopyxis carbonaria]|nr:hypothetical protein EDC01DRAFT_631103 [Geopyxis carbonaria]